METISNLLGNWESILNAIAVVIAASAVLNKAIAGLWKQTPGTPDTDIFKSIGKALKTVQKMLGAIGFDTSKIERKRDERHHRTD